MTDDQRARTARVLELLDQGEQAHTRGDVDKARRLMAEAADMDADVFANWLRRPRKDRSPVTPDSAPCAHAAHHLDQDQDQPTEAGDHVTSDGVWGVAVPCLGCGGRALVLDPDEIQPGPPIGGGPVMAELVGAPALDVDQHLRIAALQAAALMHGELMDPGDPGPVLDVAEALLPWLRDGSR